jgi:hypothetical protein
MKRLIWILLAMAVISMIYGTIYVVVQQTLRLSANDPQIALANTAADKLANGVAADQVMTTAVGSDKVNLASSQANFMILYDAAANRIASNAQLDGGDPVVPPGVITSAGHDHQNRVTWQPRRGVRLAVVVAKYPNGYVLVGRSLKEVERREQNLTYQVVSAWAVTLGLVALTAMLLPTKDKRRG